MHSFENMENNINMNYKELIFMGVFLLIVILFVIMGVFLFLRLGFHILISSEIHNKDIEVKVSFRCFFNLINITKVIYPITKNKELKKSKKKENKIDKEESNKLKSFDLKKIEIEDLMVVLKLIKDIEIIEIYSNLDYGFDVIEITSCIYVFINIIYGNIFNYFNSKEINLKIKPCYTDDYVNYIGRLHIRPTIRDIIHIFIALIKIYRKIKTYKKITTDKEKDANEISKFYKKFNGYNS